MQLNNKGKSLGARLALATGALLGATAARGAGNWQTDTELMTYFENNGRVKVLEPAFNLKHSNDDGSGFNLRLVYDSLTGASPNGAATASKPQTFTSASSASSSSSSVQTYSSASGATSTYPYTVSTSTDQVSTYTVKPSELPKDSSFQDNRFMGALSLTTPLKNNYLLDWGGSLSAERDFTSFSAHAALSRDFNDKNTTLSLGTNLEFDSVKPLSGVHTPFSTYIADEKQSGSDSKQVYDLMFGVTQVLSRRWITQLNFSTSQVSGYQNDPYKIITVAADGNLIADPTDSTRYLYLYESRPNSRRKNSVFWQNKFALFSDDALDLGYRYMKDDWGVTSHTYDVTYHWQFSPRFYLEPHYRFYRQTAADFYQPFLNAGSEVSVGTDSVTTLVDYASADPRLAAFTADTVGLKLGFPLSRKEEFDVRMEYYQQHDQNTVKAVPAGSDLAGYPQFAELKAGWIQIGYHYRW